MDWATSDYTRTYADTIFVPEPDHDSGVSLLDPSDQSDNPENGRDRLRSYGHRDGRYGRTIRHSEKAAPHNERREGFRGGARENYYTGGNVVSSHKNLDRVYDVAWDQTPQSRTPATGPTAAAPPPASRSP